MLAQPGEPVRDSNSFGWGPNHCNRGVLVATSCAVLANARRQQREIELRNSQML
jgi:hypothetical protein